MDIEAFVDIAVKGIESDHTMDIQWRREEVKAGGGILKNRRKVPCKKLRVRIILKSIKIVRF
jgi:hypothetical protein